MEEITTNTNSTQKRCAVVTGGNRGIGLEICRQLASNGIRVILTARDEKKGIEAIEKLKVSGLSDVIFHQLDVNDHVSIASLVKFIEINFGKLDILVNNAGKIGIIIHDEPFRAFKGGAGFMEVKDEYVDLLIGILDEPYEMGEECLKTNYYGIKSVTEALLPLLQLSNSARIVNLSSLFGELKWLPNETIKAELNNIDSLTEEKIDEILQCFMRDFKEHKLQTNGWPLTVSAYKLSKISINAYTRVIAKKYPNMLVNCVHPGYVTTDMTSNTGPMTPEEGASAPVMCALLPDGGPSGRYFYEMNASDF